MNLFRKLSFRKKLAAAILTVTVLVTVVTAVWSYRLALRQFREMSTQLTQNTVNTLQGTVQDYFSGVISHTTDILSGAALRKIAEASDPTELVGFSAWQAMQYDIQQQTAAAAKDHITFTSIEIHFKNGLSYTNRKSSRYADYAECSSDLSRRYGFSGGYVSIHWLPLTSEGGSWPEPGCFRYIYDRRMEPIGIALFSLNTSQVQKLFSAVDSAFLMDTDGIILAARDRTKIGTPCGNDTLLELIRRKPGSNTVTYQAGNSEQLVSYSPVGTVNCYLVVPNTEYETLFQGRTREYQRSIMVMLFSGILLSAAVSLFISQGITKDFRRLTHFIRKVDVNKNTGLRYQINGNNEFDRIGDSINTMLDSISSAALEKEENLRMTQALELRLLQAQLNPHLLYNTLNSVIWNLENEKNENAIRLIASLSGYFQYALSDGKQCITLADELKLISCYLDLQRRARHKTFTFDTDIPERILDASIPKLMLQPLVENCIRHGFDGYRDDGTVSVTGTIEDGTIILTVRDNGFGIMPDDLEELNRMLDSQLPQSKLRSFGLYGINRTIRQLYGAGYGLRVTSEMDSYTAVTIRIPYIRESAGTAPEMTGEENHV